MFIMVIIIFDSGCKKDNSLNNSTGIIGKCSWLNTCVGYGTDCRTPVSTNTSGKLVFTSDSIYNYYQNDTLKFSNNFHTYITVSEDGKYTSNIIKYDSGNWGLYSISHDTLSMIDEGEITFFTSHYKRIN
jgi:hypothetical protein